MTPAEGLEYVEGLIKQTQGASSPYGELAGLGLQIAQKLLTSGHPAPVSYLREILATGIEADAQKFAREKWG